MEAALDFLLCSTGVREEWKEVVLIKNFVPRTHMVAINRSVCYCYPFVAVYFSCSHDFPRILYSSSIVLRHVVLISQICLTLGVDILPP